MRIHRIHRIQPVTAEQERPDRRGGEARVRSGHPACSVTCVELTLAEELLLLAMHDEKGSTGFTQIDPGLAGALLVDLGQLGALRPEGKELAAVAGSGPEHPVLARATRSSPRPPNPAPPSRGWAGCPGSSSP